MVKALKKRASKITYGLLKNPQLDANQLINCYIRVTMCKAIWQKH